VYLETRLLNKKEISSLIKFVDEVEEIDTNCNKFLEVSSHFFNVMKDKDVVCYGVFNNNNLIAYCLVYLEGANNLPRGMFDLEEAKKTVVISSFLVHPTFRGKSLQRILIERARLEAIEKGFRHMVVEVNNDNKFAIINFEISGYEVISQKRKTRTYYKKL